MGLETGTFVTDLVTTNPPTSDQETQGANHLQLIKTCLHNTFPDGSKSFFLPKSLSKSANYTVLNADDNTILYCDATGGSFTLTLPTPANAGWHIRVIKVDSTANTVTILPPGTISGQASIVLGTQWQSERAEWNGSTFYAGLGVAISTAVLKVSAGGSLSGTFIGTPTFSGAVTPSGGLVGPFSISNRITFSSTDSFLPPKGTTGNRSDTTEGDLRYNSTLHGLEFIDNAGNWHTLGQSTTVATLTSDGAQHTYTPAAGVARTRVRMWGPGGGGGASVSGVGSSGGAATVFAANGGTNWSAGPGSGGPQGGSTGAGGAGGTNSAGSIGTVVASFAGQRGGPPVVNATAALSGTGGAGGSTPFVGGGGVSQSNAAGLGGVANSGSGGAGGAVTNGNGAGGGGSGGYLEFWVNAPTASLYTIGQGGAGGSTSGNAGGAGAAGNIIIEEFYS